MEFRIAVEELLKALHRAQGIAERKTTIPILANVLIQAREDGVVTFTAFDLDIGLVSEHPAEVAQPGAITLPAKMLFNLVKSFSESSVRLLVAPGSAAAEIFHGNAHFKIGGMPAEEYPSLPKEEKANLAKIDGRVLLDMIAKTSFAISTDETRYILNGLYFDAKEAGVLRVVATDGHRLSLVSKAMEDGAPKLDRGVILPRKGLFELRRLIEEAPDAESFLGFTDTSAIFKKSGLSMMMRLIDGQFPDYQEVIPGESGPGIRIERKPFVDAIRQLTCVSDGKSNSIRINLSTDLMRISANTDGSEGRNDIPIQYAGDPIEIGFNARYLTDVLGVIEGDAIDFDLTDDQSPGVIRGADDKDFVAVIMPMRI